MHGHIAHNWVMGSKTNNALAQIKVTDSTLLSLVLSPNTSSTSKQKNRADQAEILFAEHRCDLDTRWCSATPGQREDVPKLQASATYL
jgi:hypothetical protein